MRVGLIGLGPIGSVLAVHLMEAGADVVLCDIDQQKIDLIKREGIYLHDSIEKHQSFDMLCTDIGELAQYDLDLIIISVKTPVLPTIMKHLAKIDNGKTKILCAQNGIDIEETVSSTVGIGRTLRMVINYAGAMLAGNRVDVTFFNPPNYLAPIGDGDQEFAKNLAGLLTSSSLETIIPPNIQDHVWEKAILNAAASPVCAITNRNMQEIMAFAPTFDIVNSIIDEAVEIATKEGLHLKPDFRNSAISYLHKGGAHRPTMLVDLENGLPTEIESLNGKIAEYGIRHHVDVHCNLAVANLIRMMERRR